MTKPRRLAQDVLTVMKPKITLEEWGRLRYSPPPNMDTLRRWARDLKIFPFPQKVGRTYYVDADAEYREHRQHGT